MPSQRQPTLKVYQMKSHEKTSVGVSNPTSETCFLASCLLSEKVAKLLWIAVEDMFTDDRKVLFDAMLEMARQGIKIDTTTFKAEATRRYPAYADAISELIRYSKSIKNIEYAESYFQVIQNYASVRHAATVSADLDLAIASGAEPTELVSIMRKGELLLLDTIQAGIQASSTDYMKDVTEYLTNPKTDDVMLTGLHALDRHGGYPARIFHLIAARYGVGKTPMALRIVLHNAVENNIPVAFWSGENSVPSLLLALISMMTEIPLRGLMLREKDYDDSEKEQIREAQQKLMDAPIHWLPWGRKSVYQLKSEFQKLYEKHGFKIGVIDQFSHIIPDKDIRDRNQQFDILSDELFSWNETMPAWWLCLAQLKTKYVDDKPRMADVMWATRLEQNCDCGWVIDRPTSDQSRVKKMQDDAEQAIRSLTRSRIPDEQKNDQIHKIREATQKKLCPTVAQEKGRLGLGTFIEPVFFDENAKGFFDLNVPEEQLADEEEF